MERYTMRRKLKRITKKIAWGASYGLFAPWGMIRRRLSGNSEPLDLSKVRSVLAIRLDLLGDVVFIIPALRALKAAVPSASLTVLVQPYASDLVGSLPFVNRTVVANVSRWRRPGVWAGGAYSEFRTALNKLRGEQYDLCLSFYGRVAASAALLSGARFIVGYSSEGYPFNFDIGLSTRRYETRQHEAEYCLDLVRALGISAQMVMPKLTVQPAAMSKIDSLLSSAGVDSGDPFVIIHPGALNMAAKRWMPERWAAVADRLQCELKLRVVLVGSASEMPLVKRVLAAMKTSPVVAAGRTSVAELVALESRAALFLGGDSGPLHVASALDVPSISLFGPTDPILTGPLSPNAKILRGDVPCAPCYDLKRPAECLRGDHICMAAISADQVYEAAKDMLYGAEGL